VDLSPWDKLWNKGVDIIATSLASALSALLAAAIALMGWKLKLWLDLKKEKASQLQKTAIEDQIARDNTAESRRRLIAQFKTRVTVFAEETRNVRSESAAAELSTRYTKWLEDRQLATWKRNLRLIHKWGNPWNTQLFSKSSGPMTHDLDQAKVNELEADIRGTDLPDETDSEFPW
jgi:hypothetical protein